MQQTIESDNFSIRLCKAISWAWSIFMRKAGNDLLPINKEASVQLQYAYILQQILPLIRYKDDENAEIELETGIDIEEGIKEVDLFLKGDSSSGQHNIAIEMKCYKTCRGPWYIPTLRGVRTKVIPHPWGQGNSPPGPRLFPTPLP